MKKICSIVFAVLVTVIGSTSLFADCRTDLDLYISKGLDKQIARYDMNALPDYLLNVYEDDFYHSVITVHTKDIDKARLILVTKKINYPKAEKLTYTYRPDTLLGVIGDKIDSVVKELTAVKECDLDNDFHYTRYDAEKYAREVYDDSFLAVITYKGRIIWYWNEENIPDAKLLPDGRFMIVTSDSAFYITEMKDRLVAEVYSGTRIIWRGSKHTGYSGIQHPKVEILTDNVLRQSYSDPDGICVEHWKIRLTEEDVTKNIDAFYEDEHDKYGVRTPLGSGIRALLWCNDGKLEGTPTRNWLKTKTRQNMWCYHEGGKEPAADSYDGISMEKTLMVSGKAPSRLPGASNPVSDRRTSLARLIAKVKDFFAGLLA
ncbi:MAG: hypothetical protein IK083_03985 [Abditibacteriota bacterium]|nr:hypothetical protein [Abditibacteriota bacterium]